MEVSIVEGISHGDERYGNSGGDADGVLRVKIGLITGLARQLWVNSIIKGLQSKCGSIGQIGTEFGQKCGHICLVGKLRDKPGHTELVGGLCGGCGGNIIQFLETGRSYDAVAGGRSGAGLEF